MNTVELVIISVISCASLATSASAAAGDAFYLGGWKVARAAIAPWADAAHPLDRAEAGRLVGKSIVVGPHAITGPQALRCDGAHYHLSDATPDMLFQGAFGEMQSKNKSVDPSKIAASLGFVGTRIRTLETGCELDFHFVDKTTAEIGLNDYVYTLKKQ
jgi:hypothetical protein